MRSFAVLATVGMALFVGCGGTIVVGTGGGSTGTVLCIPGDQKACACPDGAQGAQACLPGGMGYAACEGCTGGNTSSSSSSGAGTTSVIAGCASDSDCLPDEACASGECVFAGCLADTGCLAGETCDTATGVCTGTPASEPTCHQCACQDVLAMGGCADLCTMGLNGTTTPNFCDGVDALPQCAKCLIDNCGSLVHPPDPTSPSACF